MNWRTQLASNDLAIVELGDPRLRRQARAVDETVSFAEREAIVAALTAHMDARGGVGIAAPQLGIPLQILIVASRPNPRYPDAPVWGPEVMLNPEIRSIGSRREGGWEGSLSVPGLRGWVERSLACEVHYQTVAGEMKSASLEGFPARVLLHEYDHLIGQVFVDHVSSSRDLVSESVYRQQIMHPPAAE